MVLGSIVGTKNGDGWFLASELSDLFEAFRIPHPPNLSATLGSLKSQDLMIQRSVDRRWSLTPLGRRRVSEVVGEINFEVIAVELAGTPGAEFAHAKHHVVSPAFAPLEWQQGIQRLLQIFPFEKNVFCMTRFPRADHQTSADPIAQVIAVLRNAVAAHGLHLHLASDRQASDSIAGNVGAHMWACQFGIGLLEVRSPSVETLNDNVLIELGSMLVTGRRCAILKDRGTPPTPSDLSGQIYKSVDFEDLSAVAKTVHRWIADDLALGTCPDCPPSISAPGAVS